MYNFLLITYTYKLIVIIAFEIDYIVIFRTCTIKFCAIELINNLNLYKILLNPLNLYNIFNFSPIYKMSFYSNFFTRKLQYEKK